MHIISNNERVIILRYVYIKKKSKNSHLKSKSHKEFEKLKHIILSLKKVDMKELDEILYLYMIYHNKKSHDKWIQISLLK